MAKFLVRNNGPLKGEVTISGSKEFRSPYYGGNIADR